MDEDNLLPVGSICLVLDPIDPAFCLLCTIKLVEQDVSTGEYFYYFIANKEESNILVDPRFHWRYCAVLECTSNRIIPLSPPSN